MQNIINWLLVCTVFIASFTCYAMGNEAGAIVLILLGFSLEILFWIYCFNKPKKSKRSF